ncbi:hypothetical protein [Kaarinaea lacus]
MNSPLSKFLAKLWILVFITLAGCATTDSESESGLNKKCSVADSLIKRNGTPGVQFTNRCAECIAVAFEYRHQGSDSKWTACYVPSDSKVVFWDADEYWLITHKSCKEVKKNGLGGIPVAEIETNDRYGRCDTRSLITN